MVLEYWFLNSGQYSARGSESIPIEHHDIVTCHLLISSILRLHDQRTGLFQFPNVRFHRTLRLAHVLSELGKVVRRYARVVVAALHHHAIQFVGFAAH